MKTILILIVALFLSPLAFAEDHHEHHGGDQAHKGDHGHKGEHKHENSEASAKKMASGEVLITVKGMVCSFCAQGIEKNFKKRDEVKDVKVDLDKMEVLITLKEGKELSESVIEEVVTGAGFKYVGMK